MDKSDYDIWKESLDNEHNTKLFSTQPPDKNIKPLPKRKIFKDNIEFKLDKNIKQLKNIIEHLNKKVKRLEFNIEGLKKEINILKIRNDQ